MDVGELYLYGGFAAGWLLGRWKPARGPWVGRATLAAVVVLVALLGASFRTIEAGAIAATLPVAGTFAALLLGGTAGVFVVVRRLAPTAASAPTDPSIGRPERLPTSAILVLALFVGYGVGRAVPVPSGTLIPVALTALLALVGYAIDLSGASVRRAWVPLVSAAGGAVVAVGIVVAAHLVPGPAAFATGLGFGWYSLSGPLVAARLGASLGLLAFLVNFLREALTMVLAPYVGPRLRGEGLAALGGATAMDTTLYFIVRYGDRRSGPLAVASGLTLTIAASLLVPFILAL